jgi:hypothetical protein
LRIESQKQKGKVMLYGELPEITLPNGEKARGIRVSVPNPPKVAFLGLPTNEQMVERLDSQKSIRRSLGRRKSQTDYSPNTKADLALFQKIRLDKDGPDFDEYEAANALGKLTSAEVTGCERDGEEYTVTLKTPFGEVKHSLNVPTQRDLQQYRRSVVSSIDLPHGVEELRYKIDPALKLYEAVIATIAGYSPSVKPADVPPHHKSAAVVELVQAIEELDLALDPNS